MHSKHGNPPAVMTGPARMDKKTAKDDESEDWFRL